MVSDLSLLEAVEDGLKLRLTWIQEAKDVIHSSLSTTRISKAVVIQSDLTSPVKKMMGLSSFPTIQEIEDSIKLLQTPAQTPKDPTEPTEIPVQIPKILMGESRKLVQRLKLATVLQVYSNQIIESVMGMQLFSAQTLEYVICVESGSIKVFEDEMKIQWPWILVLEDVRKTYLRSIQPLKTATQV